MTENEYINVPFALRIPRISGSALRDMACRIQPVKLVNDEYIVLCAKGEEDLRKKGYQQRLSTAGKMFGIEPLVQIPTLHSIEPATTAFEPSVAEVLAQMPAGYDGQALAFRTELRALFNSAQEAAWDADYHLAVTTLYHAPNGHRLEPLS